jgi:hypothetical protein
MTKWETKWTTTDVDWEALGEIFNLYHYYRLPLIKPRHALGFRLPHQLDTMSPGHLPLPILADRPQLCATLQPHRLTLFAYYSGRRAGHSGAVQY